MKNVSARMAMRARNLPVETRGDYTLVVRFYEDTLAKVNPCVMFKEFVVALHYDFKTDTWSQGHYFSDIDGAYAFFNKKREEVSEDLFKPF